MKVGPIALNPNETEKLATHSHGENLPKPSRMSLSLSLSNVKCSGL